MIATVSTRRDEFECAVVSALYLMDRRGDELLACLREPGVAARRFVRELEHEERRERARSLASRVTVIVRALEARALT